jgi:hypothetical protein
LQFVATSFSEAEELMPADSQSCELLRAIAKRSSAEQIHRIAPEVRDWDSLFNLAQNHRVLPMLFSRLADMSTAVPQTMQQRLQAAYDRNIFHNLANAAELIAVLKAFEQEMIPAMPFKGVVLGASIYQDLTTRTAGDLDLLVRYKDLTRATTILLKRGYLLETPVSAEGTPVVPNYYEYHFERPTDGMVLELRWRLELTQTSFRHDLGMDWVWPHRRITKLAGAEVPDISREITLLMLCMHGSKHVWSRLAWICDVAQLLKVSPDLDWKAVLREAKRTGLWRSLALGVLLAHRVADAEVPQPFLKSFESETAVSNLAQYIQQNLFDAPGTMPEGRVPYHITLLGFRDRARGILSLDFLQPNERDLAAISLPKSLHLLYYLIRPFRIFWDRSAR